MIKPSSAERNNVFANVWNSSCGASVRALVSEHEHTSD